MCAKQTGGKRKASQPSNHDAAVVEVHERRDRLRREAMEDYSGVVRDTAAETVSAKLLGRLPDDPDGRREKRRTRDRLVTLQDIADQAAAGVAPRQTNERSIGSSDFLKVDYFVKGLVAARAIGRLDALGGAYFGTGFLCAPGMVMTNHHVLPSPKIAELTDIGFETYDGITVIPRSKLVPDHFWWTNSDLDISIVALDPELGTAISDRLGWHPLLSEQGKIALGDPTGIVQYPEGRLKSVALHDSTVVFLKDHREHKIDRSLWYTCDTEPGASGSPVFNKHWEVVAVHHASVPATDENGDFIDDIGNKVSQEAFDKDPTSVLYVANKGIRASRIVTGLKNVEFEDRPDHVPRRDAILASWASGHGQQEALFRLRRHIAKDWADTLGTDLMPEDPPFRFDPTLESTTIRTQGDLLDQIMDRVGPGGSVTISLKRSQRSRLADPDD